MAKWRVRVSSERSETKSTDRLLNIIFSTRGNFSLFRFSDHRHRRRRLFKKTGIEWERRRGEFLRFRFYVSTACSRGARRDAPLLVLSFVNLDERSRLRPPPLYSFFFLPPLVVDDQVGERLMRWCSSPSSNGKDDDRRKSVETWRRMRELECQHEIAGIRCFSLTFETSLGTKLRVEGRGVSSFRCLDMIYNCEFFT